MNTQLRYFLHFSTAELEALPDEEWALHWQHLKLIRQAEAGHQ